jgi:hypothetical protein
VGSLAKGVHESKAAVQELEAREHLFKQTRATTGHPQAPAEGLRLRGAQHRGLPQGVSYTRKRAGSGSSASAVKKAKATNDRPFLILISTVCPACVKHQCVGPVANDSLQGWWWWW